MIRKLALAVALSAAVFTAPAGSAAALDGLIACAARNGGFNVPATPRNPFTI